VPEQLDAAGDVLALEVADVLLVAVLEDLDEQLLLGPEVVQDAGVRDPTCSATSARDPVL
jgi:hypothetical protein